AAGGEAGAGAVEEAGFGFAGEGAVEAPKDPAPAPVPIHVVTTPEGAVVTNAAGEEVGKTPLDVARPADGETTT
ncbi:MAG: hypothetical protein KC635_26735, partial [Myxococcales bacterium]|nr:hypothetical protein [Myxococcales bacterium]